MKALWIPQISSISKSSGQFLIDSDSNIITFMNYARAMHDADIDVHILLPLEEQVDVLHETNITKHEFVKPIRVKYEKDVFLSRFRLDYDELIRILTLEGPYDWIIMHDPALVMDMKVLLSKVNQKETKIATWIHWIDTPALPKTEGYFIYAYRQLEGLMTADIAITVSDTAYIEVCDMADAYLTDHKAREIRKKVTVITNPIDMQLYAPYLNHKYETPTLLFNHRTSTFPLYKTNLDRFVKLATEVKAKNDVVIIMTNPTGYRINPALSDLVDMWGPFDRPEYLDMLGHKPIITAFFDHPPLWPYAHLESAALGCPQVTPRTSPYTDMFAKRYIGFYDPKQYDKATVLVNEFIENDTMFDIASTYLHKIIADNHNAELRLEDVLYEMRSAK